MEKQVLQSQKQKLIDDLELFRKNYTDKIKHTSIQEDNFGALYVLGNFYSLAVDNFPELDKAYKDLQEKHSHINNDKEIASEIAYDKVQKILSDAGIKINYTYYENPNPKGFDRSECTTVIDGHKFNMADIHYHKYNVTGSIAALNVLISSYEYYKKSNDSVKEYLKLQEKLNSNKFADRLTSIITKRKMKELEKNNNIVTQFKVLQNNISLIQKAKNDILESKEYQTLLKATETQDNIEKLRKAERENLKKVLNEKATSVLALAYVKLYQDNFELLRMSSVGAQEKLLKLTTQDAEYYSKAAIEKVGKNVDYWLSVENVASQLHQQWREGRKNPDGTYEPRWKKVKDNAFIETVLATKNLPANIKVVDGEVQLDIANTSFDDLCLDYQIENFEAAQIALEVAKIKYTRAEAGKVGKIIHDEWLERNGWAKGSDLDVEFEELIFSEKVKDLIQYEIAKDVVKQEVRTDLI